MTRWLLITLLVLLMPLQAGWAAVGAYCADEHGQAAHQAAHQSLSPALDAHGEEAAAASDCEPGCSHCHGHGLSLPVSPRSASAQRGGCLPPDEAPLPEPQAPAPRPERPQWSALA